MRKGWMFLCVLLLLGGICVRVEAEEESQIYREQMQASAAEELNGILPKSGQDFLEDLGVGTLTPDALLQLQPRQVFSSIVSLAKEQAGDPFGCFRSIVAVLLLGALLRTMIASFGEQEYHKIFLTVSLLAAELLLILPLVEFIRQTGDVIRELSHFIGALIPTMAGIMAVNGHGFAASGYSYGVLTAAEIIAGISSGGILPITYLLLALTVTTSLTGKPILANLSAFLQKSAKWILVFAMSVFLGLLSLQSVVGASADSISIKMLKFVIGSSVPIVGGIVNEALNTVRGSLALLKTTTGAFGILAGIAILAPSLIKVILWKCCLRVCAAIGEILEQKEMAALLNAINEILGLILAILLCGCILLIVSVGILLAMGNGGR